MLISPINLCFTSRGLLCAQHQHWRSCRCRAGSVSRVVEGEDCFQISLSSFLSCVPSYIWMKKKRYEKNKSLSCALTIISQKKNRRSSLMLACVIRGHPFFMLYLFFYSTFSIYMVYLTCENVNVTSRSDCIWYDTNPCVTTSFSYDIVDIIAAFILGAPLPELIRKHPFSSKESS